MIDYFRRKRFYHYNTPGHAHELTFWCYQQVRYFDDPVARSVFLQELERARAAYRFKLFAYVIMPAHVHLVIAPQEQHYNIIRIRNGIRGCFARRYTRALRKLNDAHRSRDPDAEQNREVLTLWESGGGEDRNLWSADEINDSIFYIEANPVRLFLAGAPEQWPASSAYARRYGVGAIPDDIGTRLLQRAV
jgi:putative transposase